MSAAEHNKYLAIGLAIFAAILAFTFLLLMFVSSGTFLAIGISMANESGNEQQPLIGVAGAVIAVIFYGFLGLMCVLPASLASWRMFKRRRHARIWGIIASVSFLPIFPMGTMLGIYGLWFFFSAPGRQYYASVDSGFGQQLPIGP
jgi:hypothetical protein